MTDTDENTNRDDRGRFLPGHGAGGRPGIYSDEMADQALAIMQMGYSKAAAAGYLGIARTTFQNWEAQHPYFASQVKIGEAARVLHLETNLLKAESGPIVTSSIFALKNADPVEWRDRVVNEVGGIGGGAIKHQDVSEDALIEQAYRLGIDPIVLGLSRKEEDQD